jgi:methionyl-tRNA synthetase
VPEPGAPEQPERDVMAAAENAVREADTQMRAMRPNRALEAIFALVDTTNRYLELREPWRATKDPALAERVRTTLHTCCESLRITAILISPFLPEAAAEIMKRLGQEQALAEARLPESAAWGQIPIGSTTTKGKPLFPRIELEQSTD